MRKFLLILLFLVVGVGAYGYIHDPTEFAKLGSDLQTKLIAMFASTPSPAEKAAPVDTAPVAGTPIPAKPEWTPPDVIPSEPNWTWTTPDKIYKNVIITKIEADRVTITHAGGEAVVAIWTLPFDIQKRLNYNAAAAAAASAKRPQAAPVAEPAYPVPVPQTPYETTDYMAALSAARSSGKHVLLHFTGSDWCYYCKMLDQEVLSKSDFRQFASANYILVTLDFPRHTPILDSLKEQNNNLAQKYGVNGFPTLIVIDSSEKELGRMGGYNPGSGPDAVIAELRSYGR
jgi:thiol-disulfide isomerase/thioredoxin